MKDPGAYQALNEMPVKEGNSLFAYLQQNLTLGNDGMGLYTQVFYENNEQAPLTPYQALVMVFLNREFSRRVVSNDQYRALINIADEAARAYNRNIGGSTVPQTILSAVFLEWNNRDWSGVD